MKSLAHWFSCLILLSLLVACGKENQSGKSNSALTPYGVNPFGTNYAPIGSTPYSYQGVNVNQVLNQNPCVNGGAGVMGMGLPQNQAYANQRMQLPPIPLTGFKTQVAPGDIYVGVTSYGDVALVAGQAIGKPPLFVAYLCPRSFAPQGQAQLMNVQIGANTPNCLFKPITAATMQFPGGATAAFRWLDGGNSMGQRFAPPVCLR